MRTSGIARETKRVANALSSSRRASTRNSLQSYTYGETNESGGEPEAEEPDSGLSSPPSSPGDSRSSTVGKRKRTNASAHPTASTTASAESTTFTRRSSRKAPKLEHEDASSKRKPRRQPAKHVKGLDGVHTVEAPTNWEAVYDITAAMRKRVLAPVDTMGCENLAEDHRSPRDRRLQTLVALMLSSQTKDTVTAAAMMSLQTHLPGGFCLESLLEVEPAKLNQMIEKVGFHNNKTKFIKAAALLLRDKFGGDIPDTIDGLISLPGVGPKMAYLCMSAAWGRDEGIGVDVHVHRITNLWGWHKTSTPEQTRAELEAWLPHEKWHDINHLLVGFGQTICLPVGRRCGECDLSKNGMCPSAVASSPVKRRVKKEAQIKIQAEGESGKVVKAEEVKIERDDVAVKVEAEIEEDGRVEVLDALPGAPDEPKVAVESAAEGAECT